MNSDLDYKKSKILLFTDGERFYFDGTIQPILQRRNMLRHYHKKEQKTRKFFYDSEIFVIEEIPCESKEELNKRVQFYEAMFNVNELKDLKGNYTMLKELAEQKAGTKKNPLKKAQVSMTLRWD